MGEALLAVDVVDSAPIEDRYRDVATALLAATALTVDEGPEIVPIANGLEFVLDDGKRLYAMHPGVGGVRIRVSRAPAPDLANRISALTYQLATVERATSPCRLLVDSLKSGDDRLAGFVLSWAALEMTITKFAARLDLMQLPSFVAPRFTESARRLTAQVEARDRKVHSFRERLEALLLSLGVDTWESTVTSVTQIANEYRQPLFPEGRFDEQSLPVERTVRIARELLLQVLAGEAIEAAPRTCLASRR